MELGLGSGSVLASGMAMAIETTDTRADSVPFPPPRCPCPHAHTEVGSPNAAGGRGGLPSVAATAAQMNLHQLHRRVMNTDCHGDLTTRCHGYGCRGSWAMVGPGGRGQLHVRR
jgi:hypothetical protein